MINGQYHLYALLQRTLGRLCLLLVMLVGSLFYTASDSAVAGEGPLPIVEVKLTEFAIVMPTTVPPGPIAFSVTNAGTREHNFQVEGQGIEEKFSVTLQAGETKSLEVNLPAGTYTVSCPLDDHKRRGMQLELRVAQQQSDGETSGAIVQESLRALVPAPR